jgi:hypothetical protein
MTDIINLSERRPKPDVKEPAAIVATITVWGDGVTSAWIDKEEFNEPSHWWWLHAMISVASYQFLEMERPLVIKDAGPDECPFPHEGDD